MNTRAYNRCVEAYADGLYRFALKLLRQEADAQDLVQHAFEKLWMKHEQVEEDKAKSYLFTTLHHAAIDIIRKVKRIDWVAEIPEHRQGSSHREASRVEWQDWMDKALGQLSEVQRAVLLLRDYEGYDYREIGHITDLSESQVKVYLFRARKKMQAILTEAEKAV